MKLSTREIAVFGMLGAVMYSSKVLMEIAPNVHLLGVFTMAFTIVYRQKALYPIYTYVILNGIMAGFAYGLLQFVIEPIFYTIPQMLFDYPLPFAALGLAGFFCNKKWGLQIGYVVGVIGRYIFHVLSGYLFFAAYAPEGMHPLVYSLGYNATYIVPEAVLTLILISIPPVAKALEYVKRQAINK